MKKRDRDRFEKIMRMIPGYDPWATAEKGQWFDPEIASLAIDFFPECLCHVEGALAGQPFNLEPWQKAIVGNLYGWRQLDSGGRSVRRYREVLLYCPRKQGKTPLAAGIGLLVFTMDKEEGQQDYIAAADRDQAGMLFRQCSGMVERSPELSGLYRVYGGNAGGAQSKSLVKRNDPRSFLRVISADASSKHGGTSHLVLIDELHAQKNRELVDVLRTSMASANRIQPLLIYLTTADYERESICNEVHDHACNVRDGKMRDSRFLPIVYEAKESDPWTEPAIWKMANPNFGVSVSEEYIRREVELAKVQPAKLNEFLRLHLNVRTKARTRWLSPNEWDACGEPFDAGELAGEPCYMGVDIGFTHDMTAFVLVFPRGDEYWILPYFWMSKKQAEEDERVRGIPFRTWQRQGFITLSDDGEAGNDVNKITRTFLATVGKQYDIQEIVYDAYGFQAMAQKLSEEDGRVMVKGSMTYRTMSEPAKIFEDAIARRKLRHGGHPVLTWNAENVEVKRDDNDNIHPVKPEGARHLRIDGIIAAVLGIQQASRQTAFVSQYETEELSTL